MKRCTKCREEKPINEFSNDRKTKDGKTLWCKFCYRKALKAWKQRNPEKFKAGRNRRNKSYRKRNLKVTAAAKRRWAARHPDKKKQHRTANENRYPEKKLAQRAVCNAVRRGTLKKPPRCSRCGSDVPKEKLHGHHTDYSERLDVVWLCHRCHVAEHSQEIAEVPR